MIEYEYSFRVKDLAPYKEYCKKNGYTLEKDGKETRVLYKNNQKILARITTFNDVTTFDLKDDNPDETLIKEARETLPLVIENNQLDAILSILEMLCFSHHKTLERIRTVYTKDDIKFEIDEYLSPEKALVVAIEGEKDKLDKIYNEVSLIEKSYFRVTYEDVGIYEALELNLDKDVYQSLLKDEDISWLPKSRFYKHYKTSYFTTIGYALFNLKTLPLISKYLDADLIRVETKEKVEDVIHEDKYQVIIGKN